MQSKVPVIALGTYNQGGKLRVPVLLMRHLRQTARLKDYSLQITKCIRDNSLFTQPVLKLQFICRKEFHPMNLVKR